MAGGRAAHAFLAGEAGDQLAVADEVHHERAGVLKRVRVLVGAQNLGGRDAHAVEAAGGTLGATDGCLASGSLGDRLHFASGVLALNNLVHHGGGRRAGAGDQLGAHAVRVHGCCRQGCDGVLVQVAGDGDLGVGVAERVEQFTYTCRVLTLKREYDACATLEDVINEIETELLG